MTKKMSQNSRVKKIVIVNSDADKAHVEEFIKQLNPYSEKNILSVWYSGLILPGSDIDEVLNDVICNCDVVVFWISSDLWSNNYIFDYFSNNISLLSKSAKIIPIYARHTSGFDTFPFFQESINNILPKSNEPIPLDNFNKKDLWFENVASEILGALSLSNKKRIIKSKNIWQRMSVESRISIILIIITTIIAVIMQTPSFIADFWEIEKNKLNNHSTLNVESDNCIFPEMYNEDTLYILITRFEDFEKENDTECYGRNIERRLDFISKTKKLPLRFCYKNR